MAADQSQLEAAVRAVVDPELGLTLGDLGLLRSARARRRRVTLEVALPVAAWPSMEELAEQIHRAAQTVPGVEEVDLEFAVMTDEERAGLRQRLRAGMLGLDAAEATDAPSPAPSHLLHTRSHYRRAKRLVPCAETMTGGGSARARDKAPSHSVTEGHARLSAG